GVLLALAPGLKLRQLVHLGDFARAHADGREAAQTSGHSGIREALRVELLVDVTVDANRSDALDVPLARSESDRVEHVPDDFVALVIIGRGCGRPPHREN